MRIISLVRDESTELGGETCMLLSGTLLSPQLHDFASHLPKQYLSSCNAVAEGSSKMSVKEFMKLLSVSREIARLLKYWMTSCNIALQFSIFNCGAELRTALNDALLVLWNDDIMKDTSQNSLSCEIIKWYGCLALSPPPQVRILN